MVGADEDAGSSLKNRLKFLCSYGGKILPRPSDGQLKYVGGETRVISVPRSITFSELKEKVIGMFNKAEVVMKYQVMPEDLDALVSVRSDEDLHHMLDEYDGFLDHHLRSPSSSPRFRLFLFTSSSNSSSPAADAPLDQRYVEAINGIISTPTARRPIFTLSSSSACSSPTSTVDHESLLLAGGAARPSCGGIGMHRVRSTPNLSGSGSPRCHHHQQQPPKPAAYGGGMRRMGVAQRNEMCGCGCGCLMTGNQHSMRYYYPSSGGCGCRGHVDESPAPRSGQGFYSGGGAPPRDLPAPRKSIWE